MDCSECEKDCAMQTEKYKDVYPCMICEHIKTSEINEYCVMCIKQQFCCFKEATTDGTQDK